MAFKELNLPLIVKLYKSVGQMPDIKLKDPADPDLNYLKSSLAESLKRLGHRMGILGCSTAEMKMSLAF